jgi:hypothetical protein
MRHRSQLGTILCACILVASLLAACGRAPSPDPTLPAATEEPGPGPAPVLSPTVEAPTQVAESQATLTLPPTQAGATRVPTAAPATPLPASPAPTAAATVSPAPQTEVEPAYDDQGSPVAVLASYVNAINRGEFERAWSYWESPPNSSFEDFREGFAGTRSVLLAVRPPAWFGAAAGSTYAPLAALLLATQADGSRDSYLGCYLARRQNVDPAGDARWWLYDASVRPAPEGGSGAGLLLDVCEQVPPPGPSEPEYDDQSSPSATLASYVNALNRQEYERAWGYWDAPPNPTFEDFRQGFAGTEEAFLAVAPPTRFDAAAGSMYTSVPAVLLATHSSEGRQSFVGCYVLRRSNVDEGPQEWRLYEGTLGEVPDRSPGVELLATACPAP